MAMNTPKLSGPSKHAVKANKPIKRSDSAKYQRMLVDFQYSFNSILVTHCYYATLALLSDIAAEIELLL